MRIAITADLHLTSRERHPHRFETLENILPLMKAEGIETLIIAGDLFDASRRDYSDFEQLCAKEQYRDLQLLIIPGNHDPGINNRRIAAENVRVIDVPTLHDLEDRQFLFLPYEQGKTMGEALAQMAPDLRADHWVLIAHGDWAQGLWQPNPTEPGVYMPLTRRDIELYRPARVFLGHIHKPMDAPPVHYVGSPCGLDITEQGRRRCLLYDTDSNDLQPLAHETPVLYFDETFVILPVADEAAYLREQIASRIRMWALTPEEKARAQVRVKIVGYSADRAALRPTLREAFDGFRFYEDSQPNIDDVLYSDDLERHYIAEQVRAEVEQVALPDGVDAPGSDEVLLEALRIIYGS